MSPSLVYIPTLDNNRHAGIGWDDCSLQKQSILIQLSCIIKIRNHVTSAKTLTLSLTL